LDRTKSLRSEGRSSLKYREKKIVIDDFPKGKGILQFSDFTAVPAALEPPFFRGGSLTHCLALQWSKNILSLGYRRKNSGGRVQQDSLLKKSNIDILPLNGASPEKLKSDQLFVTK
jgi:hypothetical protein